MGTQGHDSSLVYWGRPRVTPRRPSTSTEQWMMARGPAREGGPSDPRAMRMNYDPQTTPLPYGTTSGDPYRNYPDDDPDDGLYPDYRDDYAGYRDYPDEGGYLPGRPYRRRRWRVLRWLLGL